MSTPCGRCSAGCTLIAIAASLVSGVIAAFLRITAAITVTPAFLWVLLGIAVVYLAVILVSAATHRNGCCEDLCSIVSAVLAGIIGTTVLSIVLLGITFAATRRVSATTGRSMTNISRIMAAGHMIRSSPNALRNTASCIPPILRAML